MANKMNKPELNSRNNFNNWVHDVILLLIIPLILFLLNPNIIFLNSAPGTVDAWGYLGYFTSLSEHISHYVGGYPASRLGLTLFGTLFYNIFPPLIANMMMKYVSYAIASIALYFITLIAYQDRKLALIIPIMLICHPTIWFAFGADYIDGMVIVYTLACIGFNVLGCRLKQCYKLCMILSGISMALLVSTHLFTVTLIPNIIFFIACSSFHMTKRKDLKYWKNKIYIYILGFCIAILGLSLISFFSGGQFFYFISSLTFANILHDSTINPWAYQCILKLDDYWISIAIIPVIFSIFSVSKTILETRREINYIPKLLLTTVLRNNFNQINYLLAFCVFTIFDLIEGCTLKFYFSMLVPFCFLALSEFLSSIMVIKMGNNYKLISGIAFSQASFTLLYTRFFMIGLDKVGIVDRIQLLGKLLLAFNLAIIAALILRNLIQNRSTSRTSGSIFMSLFVFGMFFSNIYFFKAEGFYANNIFSNLDQYSSYFEVTKFLKKHDALYNSLFWYNANSAIGDHFRSISSNSFLAGTLVGEKYPYATSANVDIADSQGQLNAQTVVDPESRVIVFTEYDKNSQQKIYKAFSDQGLFYNILDKETFQVGKFKFYVFIGETKILPVQERNRIYSCKIAQQGNRGNASFNPITPDCEIQLNESHNIVYFLSRNISLKANEIYLISTDGNTDKHSFTLDLHDGNKILSSVNHYNQTYNKLYFAKNNPDQPILRRNICPSNSHLSHQVIFQPHSLKSLRLIAFNSYPCDFSSLHFDKNDLKISNISIYKLPDLSISNIEPLPSLSQNLIQDWWRVRYPNLLVDDVSFDLNTQLFKIVTNKSYEDFQLVSPEVKLVQRKPYHVDFKFQMSVGGFSIILLANDGKTILSKSSFCTLQPQTDISSGVLTFNTRQFDSAKIVIANYSNCLAGNNRTSTFYIGDIEFRPVSN